MAIGTEDGAIGNGPGSGGHGPAQVDVDARGILDPERLRRVVALHRYPAGESLTGLVEWFWAVRWSLPPGARHTQQILTHPGANLSVGHGEADQRGRPGPPEAMLYGVATRLTSRSLGGTGWTVAAMFLPGGLGALLPGPASRLTDRVLPLTAAAVPGLDGPALVAEVDAAHPQWPGPDVQALDAGQEQARLDALRQRLAQAVAATDAARVSAARDVAAVARLAEADRSIRRLDQLAAAAGVTPRTLQRMFAEHAGVSPTWMLRRYRLLEAAEQARRGTEVVWAATATELGFSDQAHLVREFRSHLGTTPAAYAARQSG